jgi:hypothetical protein
MQRYNITTKRTYKDKSGNDKTQWNVVGSIVKFPATQDKDESMILELNMFPDTKFYVFEQKPKERTGRNTAQPVEEGGNVDLDDIPF